MEMDSINENSDLLPTVLLNTQSSIEHSHPVKSQRSEIHEISLLSKFHKFQQILAFTNATIIANGVTVFCHTLVLGAASKFMRNLMLNVSPIEDEIVFIIPDLDASLVSHIIRILYSPLEYCSEDNELLNEWIKILGIQVRSKDKHSVCLMPLEYQDVDDIIVNSSFVCHVCNTSFASSEHLSQHSQTHNRTKFFECSECGRRLQSRSSLSQHRQIHGSKLLKTSTCDICGKSFGTSRYLAQHRKRKHGTDGVNSMYNCILCQKALSSHHELVGHMRIHTGEKPFVCVECVKPFRLRSTLRIHMRSHVNPRPGSHICNICQHTFIQKSDLLKHMRIHTGERPFACSKCDRKFARADYLAKHMKHIHRKRPKMPAEDLLVPPVDPMVSCFDAPEDEIVDVFLAHDGSEVARRETVQLYHVADDGFLNDNKTID